MIRRFYFLVLLLMVVGSPIGCNVTPPGPVETPEPSDDALPDFSLPDVNANSPRYQENVSPRDYLGQISGWYFGFATWGYCQSQFGFLNQMQADIDEEGSTIPIRILGINAVHSESGNESMTAQKVLPWLQSTADQDVWTTWSVHARDVFIVGPGNEHLGTYNLLEHDLAEQENYATLKNLLLEAANQPDTP